VQRTSLVADDRVQLEFLTVNVWNSLRAHEVQRVAPLERPLVERPVAPPATTVDTTTKVEISRPAELLRSLSAFQQSDVKRFQEVIGAVASNLKAASNSPSGKVGADLGKLADKLMVAANSGNLAVLANDANPAALAQASSARTATAISANAGANADAPGSGFRQATMNRAIEAYRRHAPPPSDTVAQALDYVQEVVRGAGG